MRWIPSATAWMCRSCRDIQIPVSRPAVPFIANNYGNERGPAELVGDTLADHFEDLSLVDDPVTPGEAVEGPAPENAAFSECLHDPET